MVSERWGAFWEYGDIHRAFRGVALGLELCYSELDGTVRIVFFIVPGAYDTLS